MTRYVKETYEKIRSGVDFYWTGTKVLGNDVGYALSLVIKAAQVEKLNTKNMPLYTGVCKLFDVMFPTVAFTL